MRSELLLDTGALQWHVFGRDPDKPEDIIDTNQYVIATRDEIVLVDPGGTEVFPAMVTALSRAFDLARVRSFVCSHQDPDVMSSLPLWMGLCPTSRIYMPWLWAGFIAHFGHEFAKQFVKVPDGGCELPLGDGLQPLRLVPAHYCHASGNFSLYDPNTQILFSGDIGAALLPKDASDLFVSDFAAHVRYMEGFHRRWMPSNRAKDAWIARIRALEVRMICPQHGAIFRGDDVGRFLDWLGALEVGSAA